MASQNKNEVISTNIAMVGYSAVDDTAFFLLKSYIFMTYKFIAAPTEHMYIAMDINSVNLGNLADIKK